MLSDPKEIAIIAKARQKNVRDATRSRRHFDAIYADFFFATDFTKKKLLDLGPGQYDFTVLACERGAKVVGVDNDPAVLELGNYKGFETREIHLQHLRSRDFEAPFDGLFSKFSLNAFWFWKDESALRRFIEEVVSLIRPDGWAWIAPWNGVPKDKNLSAEEIDRILSVQAQVFVALGFDVFELTCALSKEYGVHGTTANRALFTRNLPIPKRLSSYRVERPI